MRIATDENLRILRSKFFFLHMASLCEMLQSISYCILLASAVINSEIILREFLGQSDLPNIYAFRTNKSAKIIMIGKNRTLNLQPSKLCRQVLKGSTITQSSWSYVLYKLSAGIIFLKKKATGCHWSKSEINYERMISIT